MDSNSSGEAYGYALFKEEKMKKKYEKPEIEITVFEVEDVITASGQYDNYDTWNTDWNS